MSVGPTQRSSSSSIQRTETKPDEAVAKSEAKPADVQPAGAHSGGAATLDTAYAEAKPKARTTSGQSYSAPSTLTRSRPPAEQSAAPLDTAPPGAKSAGEKSGVAALDEPTTTAKGSPTANLSPTELKAAQDRFGKERTYKVVDDLFHARHPELKGRQIKPGEKALAKEWTDMRAGVEEAGIQKMVADGKSDPKEISRDVFDARHPDLKGKKLSAPQQKELGEIEKQVNTSLEPLKNLQGSASFKALDAEGQKQALALMRANYQDPDARGRVQEALDSTGSVKSAAGKAQVLEGLVQGSPLTADKLANTKALLGSPKFAGLSEANQNLITEGLKGAKADPKFAENTKKLIEDPKFAALKPDEQTAVLSQVKNYPDSRSVGNLQRLVNKDWFNNQDLADKQRSLKTVAYLSQYDGGHRATVDNTLDKMLNPSSDFKLQWKDYASGGSGTTYGEGDHDTKTLYLNRGLLSADNDKMVENNTTKHLVLHTAAHEVNHILNKDEVDKTFKYFEAEYRAWYTGFTAEHGQPPTNQEAMEQRIRWQLNPSSFYGKYAAQAMKDPAEAQKFYDFLSKTTGQKVDASNWKTVAASDPSTWKTKPGDPAPVPSGNLDNH
jgi:hypothetical protein